MSLSGIQRSDSITHILFQILFHDGLLRLKRLPPVRETQVRYLGREDPLEKEMAIHSSILAWRIPWTEKSSRLQSTGSQRVGHDWSDLAAAAAAAAAAADLSKSETWEVFLYSTTWNEAYKKAVVHIHNGVLLSHWKEYIWISSNEMDETGADYTEWSKPERKTPIQYTDTYIWNLERW